MSSLAGTPPLNGEGRAGFRCGGGQVPWKKPPPKWHENPTYLLMILGIVIALLLFGWSF
jgi:hypothetical protein